MSTTIEEIVNQGNLILKNIDHVNSFQAKYGVLPKKSSNDLAIQIKEIIDTISETKYDEINDTILANELKRKLNHQLAGFEFSQNGTFLTYDETIDAYSIPREDIENLRPWLVDNKEKVLDSVERLFSKTNSIDEKFGVSTDIPHIKRQVEEFAAVYVEKYHKTIGKYLQNLTNIGEFLRDIDAYPSITQRSYFNPGRNIIAIGIPAICYMKKDGSIELDEANLISLYGHEGMGHALNTVITEQSDLPFFLKRDSTDIKPTKESVAQFYEKQILTDLKDSVETQKALGIDSKFNEIFQDIQDKEIIQEYKQKQYQHFIQGLADKSFGDPKNPKTLNLIIEHLAPISLNNHDARDFIEQNKMNFDHEGNLYPTLISELKYSANPVKRAIDHLQQIGINYSGEDRSFIDKTILEGFWTPTGFIENAKYKAELFYEKKQTKNKKINKKRK